MTRKNEREIVLLALKFPKKCSYNISFKISLSNILPNLTDIQCITLIYIYICNTFLNQHCSSYEDVPIYIPM